MTTLASALRAVDRVDSSERDGVTRIHAELAVGDDREHLRGHFPGRPVYPGVGVLESVTQALSRTCGRPMWLRELRSARFQAPVPGGDTLRLDIGARPIPSGWQVEARGTRADGSLTATIRASFDDRTDLGGPAAPQPAPPGTGAAGFPEIRALLPHRHPFLLVDRVRAVEAGRRIWAEKAVTATEPCYRDADADPYPVPLMLESLGQAAALLWLSEGGPLGGDVIMLAAVRDYRVTGHARPGDVLRHVVKLDEVKAGTAFASGATWSAGRCIATVGTLIAVQRPSAVLDSSIETR